MPLGEKVALPWQLPVPSTSFVAGPDLQDGRTSILSWTYEGDSGYTKPSREGIFRQELTFEGVVAYKCTYNLFCSVEIIKLAYDKVVDLGDTEWLSVLKTGVRGLPEEQASLRHLAIFFDEGPCYEFICETVWVSEVRE